MPRMSFARRNPSIALTTWLLCTLATAGCTLSPKDGARIPHASDEIVFTGYAASPGGVVRLEARDSRGVFREIASVSAGTRNENVPGSTMLYSYSLRGRVPKAFWKAATGTDGRRYHAQLRMRTGDVNTLTFTEAGGACVQAEFNKGVRDIAEIGQKCSTGNEIALVADAVSPAQRSVSKDGFLCAGLGATCQWRPRLMADVVGLSGCAPNYVLDLQVKNTGDIPGSETIESTLRVSGDHLTYTCDVQIGEDPAACLNKVYAFVPFYTGTVTPTRSRVTLAAGASTLIHHNATVSIPNWVGVASLEATTPGGRSWQSEYRPSSLPTDVRSARTDVCIYERVGDAGG